MASRWLWNGSLHFRISTGSSTKRRHKYFGDAEGTLNAYKRDGGVLRLNHYAIKHEPYNPNVVGGLAGVRDPEEAQTCAEGFAKDPGFEPFMGPLKRQVGGTFSPNFKRLPFSPKRLAKSDLEELNAYLEWDGLVPDTFGDSDVELLREMMDWYRGEI